MSVTPLSPPTTYDDYNNANLDTSHAQGVIDEMHAKEAEVEQEAQAAQKLAARLEAQNDKVAQLQDKVNSSKGKDKEAAQRDLDAALGERHNMQSQARELRALLEQSKKDMQDLLNNK